MFFHFDAETFQFPRIFFHFDAETYQFQILTEAGSLIFACLKCWNLINRCLDSSPDSRHERADDGLLRLGLSGAELLLVPEAELGLIMQPPPRGLSVVEVREPSSRDTQPAIPAHHTRGWSASCIRTCSPRPSRRSNQTPT